MAVLDATGKAGAASRRGRLPHGLAFALILPLGALPGLGSFVLPLATFLLRRHYGAVAHRGALPAAHR